MTQIHNFLTDIDIDLSRSLKLKANVAVAAFYDIRHVKYAKCAILNLAFQSHLMSNIMVPLYSLYKTFY